MLFSRTLSQFPSLSWCVCVCVCVQAKDLERAEGLFVDAKKPELALRAYLEAKRYPDALR